MLIYSMLQVAVLFAKLARFPIRLRIFARYFRTYYRRIWHKMGSEKKFSIQAVNRTAHEANLEMDVALYKSGKIDDLHEVAFELAYGVTPEKASKLLGRCLFLLPLRLR